MPRFSFEVRSGADMDSVFGALSGYGRYHELLPEYFTLVRSRSSRGATSVAEIHARLGGMNTVMMTRHVSEAPSFYGMYVIGGDMRGSSFEHRLAGSGAGTTVSADVNLRPGRLHLGRRLRARMIASDYEGAIERLVVAR